MNFDGLGRIPPQEVEAESCALGCMMLDKDALYDVLDILTADDFFREDNKEIFEAVKTVADLNKDVDIITVEEQLKKRGTLDNIGGMSRLVKLASNVPTIANAKHYSRMVNETATLRKLIRTSTEIINACYERKEDVEEIVQKAESQVFMVNEVKKDNMVHASVALSSALSKIQEAEKNKGVLPGLPTGFTDLDHMLGGLQKGDLILVAGRPSMGKTALAINIAEHTSIDKQIPTAIFSMEMSKEKLMNRILSGRGSVVNTKIKLGTLDDGDYHSMAEQYESIYNSKMEIEDTNHLKPSEIRSRCRRLKKKYGELGLIVVDHLTELWRPMTPNNDVSEHSENIRQMKRLAKEMDCPVILLQQLSRKVEARQDKRPMMSDLRETGVAEEVADVIMMIYRDDYYNKTSDKKGIAEIEITKGRDTGTGIVELVWLPQYTKFCNIQKFSTAQNKTVEKGGVNADNKQSKFKQDELPFKV